MLATCAQKHPMPSGKIIASCSPQLTNFTFIFLCSLDHPSCIRCHPIRTVERVEQNETDETKTKIKCTAMKTTQAAAKTNGH